LRGPSGSGKSLAAFELIRRGHVLIADDMVQIQKTKTGLMGLATPPLAGFLHIHDIGLIDVAEACGKKALRPAAKIDLIIECLEHKQTKTYNRLSDHQKNQLAGVKLPIYKMKSGTSAGFIEAAALKEKHRVGYPEKKLALAVKRLVKTTLKQKTK
jgi:HPr kinase/phosphorylase